MLVQSAQSQNKSKKRRYSSTDYATSSDFVIDNQNIKFDIERLRQGDSMNQIVRSSFESPVRSQTSGKDQVQTLETATNFSHVTASSGGTCSFWECKCAILQEEMRLHQRKQERLKALLEQERQLRKRKEIEIQRSLANIQELKREVDLKNTATTAALEEKLKEEKKMREQDELIIKKQQLEIQRLSDTSMSTGKLMKQKYSSFPSNGSTSNDCDTRSDREQLIKARRKQLELIRVIEGWKQKAMELKGKLDMINQSQSRERRIKIAQRRRLQTAEQLLQIGKAVPHPDQSISQSKTDHEIESNDSESAMTNENNKGHNSNGKRESLIYHAIASVPNHLLKFDGKRWIESTKDKYPSRKCRHAECTKRVRTFCQCSPGYWMCPLHVEKHIVECS